MAEDAPQPAKPVKKAATTATPRKRTVAAKPAATPKPKPAKPLKGPTVTTTESKLKSAAEAAPKAASDTAKATVQSLKDNAAKMSKDVGAKARTYAEDGKARAGGALEELAKLMTDAAGTVDEKVGPQYGQYARTAADAVSGFSDSLKSKNVDDLIADATGFVKKSPAIAIGTAAAIGFVLIRLVQSSLNNNDKA